MSHRSVSQVLQYRRCPYSYKLSRLDKAPQRPAAWLVQGSAFHTAAELYERSDRKMSIHEVLEAYGKAYERETQKYCQTHPSLDSWFPSGPYRGPQDLERRFLLGAEQVRSYAAWAGIQEVATGRRTWTTPRQYKAVEIPFDVQLGEVQVRGFIDKVDEIGPGLRAVDYKTGNKPGDPFQLATYVVALFMLYGITVSASFWMAKTGRETEPLEFTEPPVEEVTKVFAETDKSIQSEEFPPIPTRDNCQFCSVAASCEYRFSLA